VRMVADVTETRNVISSLEFKTCMTIKTSVWICIFRTVVHSAVFVDGT